VNIEPLSIPGALRITPRQHLDDRGSFLEWFRADEFRAATGADLALAQGNCSVSMAGVVRGIHYAEVPPGQAKYVTCIAGAVFDVAVDLRVGSPTFGQWEGIVLDDVDRQAMYLPDGLGHAFMSLAEGSTVVYLCSTPYTPHAEHALDPFDPEIGITWAMHGRDGQPLSVSTSPRDAGAPSLRDALERGQPPLPRF
jgi:dTDP-4-dehydrorhamnose 3,5-epimerase